VESSSVTIAGPSIRAPDGSDDRSYIGASIPPTCHVDAGSNRSPLGGAIASRAERRRAGGDRLDARARTREAEPRFVRAMERIGDEREARPPFDRDAQFVRLAFVAA